MKRASFGLVLALILSACTYRPGLDDNPITRRSTWYSYVEGSDIRAACRKGGPDAYRLVYNGRYTEQIRLYDLGQSGPLSLNMRAVDAANLTNVTLDDLLAPWRGKAAQVTLTEAQRRELLASFEASGLFAPPPVGLELPSDQFYWTAAYCRDGRYGFTAWLHPSYQFDRITFPKLLQNLDRTGVAFNPPRKVGDNVLERRRPDEPGIYFQLRVGESGLWGLM